MKHDESELSWGMVGGVLPLPTDLTDQDGSNLTCPTSPKPPKPMSKVNRHPK